MEISSTHRFANFFSAFESSFFLAFFAFTGGSSMTGKLWSSDAFSTSSACFLFFSFFKKNPTNQLEKNNPRNTYNWFIYCSLLRAPLPEANNCKKQCTQLPDLPAHWGARPTALPDWERVQHITESNHQQFQRGSALGCSCPPTTIIQPLWAQATRGPLRCWSGSRERQLSW